MRPGEGGRGGRTFRCAIYTRKSTEEGLEQAFNSLDAQREACAAYILSQRHEGWTLVPDSHDDGGFSGGNMDRPGLKSLLQHVRAGKVDVIVVYKVDRLTRSLADFAKIVEVLDSAGASFVSVTQAFNTTTSMGRLTLNVLLSFAQFEREVTGERIRDKIAASKRKGLWMGGPVPLGYEVRDRKLVVNEREAETVRLIMRRYLELGSVRELIDCLKAEDIHTKVQQRTSGPHKGGIPFARGSLYHLLKNRIYLGEIIHKDAAFPGEHEPIVPHALWDEVQAKLASKAADRRSRINASHPSLLASLLHDGLGRRMSPSHAVKGSRRYRYYITHERDRADRSEPAWRVPAHDIEKLVVARLAATLTDAHAIHDAISDRPVEGNDLARIIERAGDMARQLSGTSLSNHQSIVARFVTRIDLHDDRIDLTVDLSALDGAMPLRPIPRSVAIMRIRRDHDVRLVLAAAEEPVPVRRDATLIRLVADAVAARDAMLAMPGQSISALARAQGRCRKTISQLLRLGHLAPDIITAIVEGRQPETLTRSALLAPDLPISWAGQRRVLGFVSASR